MKKKNIKEICGILATIGCTVLSCGNFLSIQSADGNDCIVRDCSDNMRYLSELTGKQVAAILADLKEDF